MKQLIYSSLLLGFAFGYSSCDQKGARYIDPNTGIGLNLVAGDSTGRLINAETGALVELYVDTQTGDTIYTGTGAVVNGNLNRDENGRYYYLTDESDYAAKETTSNSSNTAYVFGSEPNEVKRKGPNYKYKGGKGEYRIKRKGYKKEVEKDGDITIKDGRKKIKIEGETGRRKVKWDD